MLPPEIEQMLMAAAVERASSAPSSELAAGAGAAVGGLAGVGIGQLPHMVGRGIGHVRGTNHMMKPGVRMAGGLIGMALGGGLGEGLRQMMIKNSPEAEILARYQTGTQAPGDDIRLQQLLADQYKTMGLA